MKFKCRYICRQAEGEYFRTVWGDDVNEATKQAERYTKKGYMLVSVVQGI